MLSAGAVDVRKALGSDYAAYARLFPELSIDDPVPSRELWVSEFAPTTWIALIGAAVVGYCYYQEYERVGYVRNVVVAPEARKRGVGRALMQATAELLRAHGKESWHLNVKPDNVAALALYARLSFERKYAMKALRFPWRALDGMPAGQARVREIAQDRDALLERRFGLLAGQIELARRRGRVLLEAASGAMPEPTGLAVFDPKFPGAFPFCADADSVGPLLRAMRPHVPTDEQVNLVVEDDDALSRLLLGAGANLRLETLHLAAGL